MNTTLKRVTNGDEIYYNTIFVTFTNDQSEREEKVIETIRNANDLVYLMNKLSVKTLSYNKLAKLVCRIKNVN